MTPQFHSLKIADRRQESSDAISLAFDVPAALKGDYRFTQGQYLTLKTRIEGVEVRRSYSICTAVSNYLNDGELRVAIKKVEDGVFSSFAHSSFKPGIAVEVMTPEGRFFSPLDEGNDKHYLAFAAGSGITPILSIMKTTLEVEGKSRFTLVYGNRNAQQVLFLEEIEALKNCYLDRVRLIHILSNQPQEAELFNGRINRTKTEVLLATLIPFQTIDQAFICGPSSMIDEVEAGLLAAGVAKNKIHAERFGVQIPKVRSAKQVVTSSGKVANLKIMLDGKIREMPFPFDGEPLLDVALAGGLDLPFACKGGVCCTCRAKVLEGEVRMDKNYTLEDWEVKKGFVLTCQCHPVSDTVLISFDER
jgi:ring-1,2-phenylacetyl-CoA epoxidase subunit PaaE